MSAVKKRKAHDIVSTFKDVSVLSDKLSVLDADIYSPQSQLTAGVYKEILALLQNVLIGESSEALYEAAHDVILTFKTDLSDSNRRSQVCEILAQPGVSDEFYSSLFRLCALISDFKTESKEEAIKTEDAGGIAITFDADEDESDAYDVSSIDEEGDFPETKKGRFEDGSEVVAEDENESPVSSEYPWSDFRDGMWLRRALGKVLSEEEAVTSLESEVYRLLDSSMQNSMGLENQLVSLFKFQHFHLLKAIVDNRFKLWLGRRCRTEADRAAALEALLEFGDAKASELHREVAGFFSLPSSNRLPQPSSISRR